MKKKKKLEKSFEIIKHLAEKKKLIEKGKISKESGLGIQGMLWGIEWE